MAESEANQATDSLAHRDEGEKHLKYLQFVQSAVIYFVVCCSTVYEYAKENAGSLKPSVQTAENTVKNVFGPVYARFQDVPLELLKFVDLKVGDALTELNRHVPERMKQIPNRANYVAHNLPEVTRDIALEAFKMTQKMANTLYIKYEPTAKELYNKYEPVAEKYAVSTWQSMNKLPFFPQVAQIAVPTGAYVISKYNYTVCYTAEKGYLVPQYLPLVPLDKIAKVFQENEIDPTVETVFKSRHDKSGSKKIA
ncbi:stress-related protein-like [Rutidosis leptorrhynchoides]|uniref:stress-related protein-like n=1 Tax=Rutidosis leptorrhynchoides TaxID=125765 RepID=UPI003A997145